MSLGEPIIIRNSNPDLFLKIHKGHFATSHSHTNYFIDVAPNKAGLREAKAVGNSLAEKFRLTTPVDTILCLDNTEVIGAFLAHALTKADRYNVNENKDVFVLTPEHTAGSQLFFRDNTAPMIAGKAVLILVASLVTGYTAQSAVEAVRYFGGEPVGIAAIFSTSNHIQGLQVQSVFGTDSMPGYMTSSAVACPLCRRGEKLTALVNTFGCSAL